MLVSQVTLKRNLAHLLVSLFAVVFLSSEFMVADVLILKNGDRITGKIKKLNNGDLEIDPPYGENIFIIDWNEVERIESERNFIAQTSGGEYVTGSVRTDPENMNRLLIEGDAQCPLSSPNWCI